jgi:hypothetical protein
MRRRLAASNQTNTDTSPIRLLDCFAWGSPHMGSRSLKLRRKSPLISNRAVTNESKEPQMIPTSNATSHGTALERTSLPLSRRPGRASGDDASSPLTPEDGAGLVSPTDYGAKTLSSGLSQRDRKAMALLIILCQSIRTIDTHRFLTLT